MTRIEVVCPGGAVDLLRIPGVVHQNVSHPVAVEEKYRQRRDEKQRDEQPPQSVPPTGGSAAARSTARHGGVVAAGVQRGLTICGERPESELGTVWRRTDSEVK